MKVIESEVKKLKDSGFVKASWLGGQHNSCSQEEWKDPNLHQLPWFKCRLSKRWIFSPDHERYDWQNVRFWEDVFHRWLSGYNQIKMYPEDEKHTSFRTSLRVYCYTVMPFGLKNASATYQCAMNAIFHKHIRKTVNATSTISVWKAVTKAITSQTKRECSTSCGLTSVRWTKPSPS